MKSNYKSLIAYATAFVSFVLPKIDVDEVIIFGSTVREEASIESDIDLFFNTKTEENKIKKILNIELEKFYKSSIYEQFSLKGIKNKISIKVGNLDKWKLKRSIISEGIVLYGKYNESPENLKGFTLFVLKPIKNITKRNRIMRRLFGRKEKNQSSKGIIEDYCKKLSPTSFIVPIEKTHELVRLLNKEKLDYKIIELFSDQI